MKMQVAALNVRSKGKADQPKLAAEEELDYAQSLNKGLPSDIRILGWCDIEPDFSARRVVMKGFFHPSVPWIWIFHGYAWQRSSMNLDRLDKNFKNKIKISGCRHELSQL